MTDPAKHGMDDTYIPGDRLPVGEVFEDHSDAAWDLWMQAAGELETQFAKAALTSMADPEAPPGNPGGCTYYLLDDVLARVHTLAPASTQASKAATFITRR